MLKKLLVLTLLLHLSYRGFAQTPGGGGGGSPVDCDMYPDDPECAATETPIDSGTGFLIAAGIAYGLKKLKEKKKMAELA